MTKYSNATSNMDHAENFIDLDDLDLTGIELTSWETVAGGSWFTFMCGGCNTAPTTTATCSGNPY